MVARILCFFLGHKHLFFHGAPPMQFNIVEKEIAMTFCARCKVIFYIDVRKDIEEFNLENSKFNGIDL